METFSALLALCAGNSPVTGEFPHKGQWRGALMFSLICAWINSWVNNRKAGDLRRSRAHYDVIEWICYALAHYQTRVQWTMRVICPRWHKCRSKYGRVCLHDVLNTATGLAISSLSGKWPNCIDSYHDVWYRQIEFIRTFFNKSGGILP